MSAPRSLTCTIFRSQHNEEWMQTMQKVLTIAVAVLALAVGTSGVLAQGKGKSGGSPGFQGNSMPPNWDKGERKGWKESDTPPGWTNEQGQRKGWNGQNVPPGFQAK
jgi:hypothetical protein